jgi:CubicO group peptidase (beta-lactamase class C family)
MLVDRGRTRDGREIISEKTLSLMLSDQMGETPGFGGERSPNKLGLGFYVLENPELGGNGAPKGIYGWGGYHTTHFWIDPVNELYAIFLTRLYPTPSESLQIFRTAVYESLGP